jgi:hypothetical protein
VSFWKQLVYYPKRSNLVRPTFRVDDQSPVLPDKHETYRHYGYKHSYSSIDTSHRPFRCCELLRRQLVYYPKGSQNVLPAASVLTINRPFSDLHVNYQHYHYLQAQLFEYRYKPPTLSAAATFCGGSWYTTRKDPPKMYGPRAFRVDDQSRSPSLQ